MSKRLRIAVIFTRLGPYHVARLEAAAAAFGADGDVIGIEVARTDGIYEWDGVTAGGAARLVTLFPSRHYGAIGGGEIRAVVSRALDEIDPDAVAINGWSMAEARAAIAWAERRDRIAVLMSETKADDAPRVWWKELVKRRLIARCDAALVGGTVHARYLEQMGFPRERIAIGYDVVDNAHFRRGAAAVRADGAARRAAAGLPDCYFLACTRFIARKNVDTLLRAYAGYRGQARGTTWGLVIAGGGEDAARLKALEQRLGLEGVIWPGFIQYGDLPLHYGLASAFVHAASGEPWGLVVNEAIASGLPVIVSRTVGAASELVVHGVNGYVVDPLSVEDLAHAMARMAELSTDERAKMGCASAATAEAWEPERFGAGLVTAVGMGKRGSGRARAAAQPSPALVEP